LEVVTARKAEERQKLEASTDMLSHVSIGDCAMHMMDSQIVPFSGLTSRPPWTIVMILIGFGGVSKEASAGGGTV